MGEMAALWSYEEPKDMDQLAKKLLSTTLELEKLQSEARMNKEYVNQLIRLVKFAIQERDEARDQLEKFLSKTTNIVPLPNNTENFNPVRHFDTHHHHNNNNIPTKKPIARANSSVSESNSLSETYNYHSHVSSPVESLFETVTSPLEFSNTNTHQPQQPFTQENANSFLSNGPMVTKLDQGSLIIDNLAKGRVLPQRGKFVKAVLEAGPLLNTLLVAGPLPRWRNPPQIRTFDQIPNVSMRGSGVEFLGQKTMGQVNYGHMSSHNNVPCGSAQVFGSLPGSGFVVSGQFGNDAGFVSDNGCYRLAKRQRLC